MLILIEIGVIRFQTKIYWTDVIILNMQLMISVKWLYIMSTKTDAFHIQIRRELIAGLEFVCSHVYIG